MKRTPPEQQGIASPAVLRFVESMERDLHEIHSFMLVRHGNVVAEGWWSPYKHEHPHMMFSVSKSFTSTAVGLAVAEGFFGIDDLVLPHFSDQAPKDIHGFWEAVSVKHLLTMATGQAIDTWSSMVERTDGNWIRGFFEVPVQYAPGTRFVYNTGATYMLSAIVQKTTGMKVLDFLESRLFVPLGIKNTQWPESPEGITMGGIGLSLKTEDIARFGQLYLQKGVWQGTQILPEDWVAEATAAQISNSGHVNPDWAQGYGYQFWRCRHGVYRGDGVFGQYCIVMPQQDAVLAITAGLDIFDMQQPLELVWAMLLPAMGSEPLADNPTAHRQLTERLSGLTLLPVQGQSTSPLVQRISQRMYRVDVNEQKIETIRFSFSESVSVVHVKTALSDETIPCGYGQWSQGHTSLFSQPLLFHHTSFAASGAWSAEDSYVMVIRLNETPFFHTLVCHFVGDDLMIEIQINVSLGSLEPLLLTASSHPA